MNIRRTSACLFLAASALLAVSTTAQAASFTTNFTQSNGSEGDTWLNSVTQKGVTVSNFSLVKSATILSNTPITGKKTGDTSNPEAAGRNNNTGAASTDKGDKATSPMPVSGMNDPTGAEIASFLGNRNLSNIIDTEDSGSFKMNLFFDKAVAADKTGLDSIFFWERGMNSNLNVQAIDKQGNLIGNLLKLNHKTQKYAGYTIDTMEIASAQKVGSWGINMNELGVTSLAGIQVIANGSSSNGPDFKVMARETSRSIPEPGTVGALLLTGFVTLRFGSKRKAV